MSTADPGFTFEDLADDTWFGRHDAALQRELAPFEGVPMTEQVNSHLIMLGLACIEEQYAMTKLIAKKLGEVSLRLDELTAKPPRKPRQPRLQNFLAVTQGESAHTIQYGSPVMSPEEAIALGNLLIERARQVQAEHQAEQGGSGDA